MLRFVPRSLSEIASAILSNLGSDPRLPDHLLPSDLQPGSLELAHAESLAAVLEETDQRFSAGAEYAIANSVYEAFGFGTLEPRAAVGSVVFSSWSPAASLVTIPAGVQVAGPNAQVFVTTASGSIQAGSAYSGEVPVVAVTPGAAGNVPAGSLDRTVARIPGVDAVTNALPLIGGQDEESATDRDARFKLWLASLPRGTTAAIEYAVRIVPGVADVSVVEPGLFSPRPDGVPFAGLVWVFVDDRRLDPDLLPGVASEIGRSLNGYTDGLGRPVAGWKAAGVVVDVKKALHVPCYLRLDLRLSAAGVARADLITALLLDEARDFFDASVRIGGAVSYQNLVSRLTGADPDVLEVDLVMWLDGQDVPAYGAPISASDLTVYNPAVPDSLGYRATLAEGPGPSPSGGVVTYPEVRLV